MSDISRLFLVRKIRVQRLLQKSRGIGKQNLISSLVLEMGNLLLGTLTYLRNNQDWRWKRAQFSSLLAADFGANTRAVKPYSTRRHIALTKVSFPPQTQLKRGPTRNVSAGNLALLATVFPPGKRPQGFLTPFWVMWLKGWYSLLKPLYKLKLKTSNDNYFSVIVFRPSNDALVLHRPDRVYGRKEISHK